MPITVDHTKRAKALEVRGLDFKDAEIVFKEVTFEMQDIRKDYGEKRIICYGWLAERMGCDWLCTTWRGSSHFQYEESQ